MTRCKALFVNLSNQKSDEIKVETQKLLKKTSRLQRCVHFTEKSLVQLCRYNRLIQPFIKKNVSFPKKLDSAKWVESKFEKNDEKFFCSAPIVTTQRSKTFQYGKREEICKHAKTFGSPFPQKERFNKHEG